MARQAIQFLEQRLGAMIAEHRQVLTTLECERRNNDQAHVVELKAAEERHMEQMQNVATERMVNIDAL